MKCDHIRTRAQGDTPFFPNILNNGNVEVCLKEDVDEAIAELKEENLNLKAKNTELQSFYDLHGNVDNYIDKLKAENAELKQKLEDAEADAAETLALLEERNRQVGELTENERRLKRALWLARASEASKEVNYWNCENESSYAIVDFNVHHETIVSYKAPHHRPYKWILIWENVERKCRAKAESYL